MHVCAPRGEKPGYVKDVLIRRTEPLIVDRMDVQE